MVAEDKHQLSTHPLPDSKLCTTLNNRSIFQDVAGDITVVVDGESFLLHKFPLVTRSGKIRKMVADAKDSKVSKLELHNLPGGSQAFELAAKFCYGMNFEITAGNVAYLRCAAEYLEMTEDYQQENLIVRTEAYLDEVVVQSIEKSVEVLSACESLPISMVEEVGIPSRCVNAIAANACREQLASGFSHVSCHEDDSAELKEAAGYIEWWVEDLSVLRIDFYQQVISAMAKAGVDTCSIIASLMHYAQEWLKGIGKLQIWNPARLRPHCGTQEHDQKVIIEALVDLLPTEKSKSSPIPLSFLFGLLRMAIIVDANISCRVELERQVGCRLEMVSLDDLLIPSVHKGDSLFDVDTVCRILANFLQRMEDEETTEDQSGYESQGFGSPTHGSLLKVGRLIDAYLAEIAPDPYLSLQKFTAIIEALPDYARVIDDGLYRALDIYLKAHPMISEDERNKLCKYIDCQKLSNEACNHAAQNDRLPVQMTVRVLYFEQLRLKNSMSGSSGDALFSQKISSGIPSAAMSPRDTYASLRRENRELKLEISRLRMRLNDLEKEQTCMKQDMLGKSGNGKTFLTSLSKGIGKIGIFSTPMGNKRQKSGRKGKTARSRRHSVS
ncbi:BTB/POZ domain-containing protein At3g08570 isoform X1 [Chenopodium quinoa]|uniref:BTB/POZ domain-containing protein At3g08570 isoform X1 n=1 Tax=Chenopodium quinoa TaxID=63459 RepID=UPI000B786739|nr:BTB/POZ domain-containing protein At3g08570 isoform X1 [Chenopodium quinoa]